MKAKLSVAALLSTTTVTGAVWLATVNPIAALASPFNLKGVSENANGNPASLVSDKMNLKQLAIAGAGIATLAGLTAAGVAFKAHRIKTSFRVFADNSLQ